MPYIRTTTTAAIDGAKENNIKAKLGKAIELLPGKTERWLMLCFEGNMDMSFGGRTDEDFAMAEVSIFGSSSDAAYEKLTKAICAVYEEELGIKPENTYVKYTEISRWGWNNGNF